MSNEFEKLEHNMVKISMEIGQEEFDKACERAYQKNKNQISLPGFRKGKAPRKMIERVYGKEVFYEDALNDVLPGSGCREDGSRRAYRGYRDGCG